MSLKSFHLVFILSAMILMDLFGFWGIWHYQRSPETSYLLLGIVGFVSGLALAGYALFAGRELRELR